MLIYIFIVVIVVLLLYVLMTYNNFIKLNNKFREAFSTMDVYLKKRWDLIPNIVEAVKGYTKYEEETLEEIIKLRDNTYDKMSTEEKILTNEQLAPNVSKIMMLVESYPDLKANHNFLKLGDELIAIENDIANSRKYYNAVVRIFNNKVQMFPSNVIANIFGYKNKKMFEASATERENVRVDL